MRYSEARRHDSHRNLRFALSFHAGLTLALTGAPRAGATIATNAKAVMARRARVQRGVRQLAHYSSNSPTSTNVQSVS